MSDLRARIEAARRPLSERIRAARDASAGGDFRDDVEGPFPDMGYRPPSGPPTLGEIATGAPALGIASAGEFVRGVLNSVPEAVGTMVEAPAKVAKGFLGAAEPGMRRMGLVPPEVPSGAYQQAMQEAPSLGLEAAGEWIKSKKIPPGILGEGSLPGVVGEGVGIAAQAIAVPGSTAAKIAFAGSEAAAIGYVSNLERAKAAGADAQTAFASALAGAGIQAAGATLPLHQVLSRWEKASGGAFSNALRDAVLFGGAGATQTALNERVMELATGEDLPVLQNALEALGTGALTGPLVGAVGHVAQARARQEASAARSEGTPEAAPASEATRPVETGQNRSEPVKTDQIEPARGDDMPPDAELGMFRDTGPEIAPESEQAMLGRISEKMRARQPFARGEDMPPDAGLEAFRAKPEPEVPPARGDDTPPEAGLEAFRAPEVVEQPTPSEPRLQRSTEIPVAEVEAAKPEPAQEPVSVEEQIRELRKKHSAALATPLASEGGISPVQIGRMSKKQREKWSALAQERMVVESQIRDLQRTPEQIRRSDVAESTQRIQSEINSIDSYRQTLLNVGVGKSGKIRPKYQAEIDKLSSRRASLVKELESLSGSTPVAEKPPVVEPETAEKPARAKRARKVETEAVSDSPLSGRELAKTWTPTTAYKSPGHVGFFKRPDGGTSELWKAPNGDLYRSDIHDAPDAETGYRFGRFEATKDQADKIANYLLGKTEHKPSAPIHEPKQLYEYTPKQIVEQSGTNRLEARRNLDEWKRDVYAALKDGKASSEIARRWAELPQDKSLSVTKKIADNYPDVFDFENKTIRPEVETAPSTKPTPEKAAYKGAALDAKIDSAIASIDKEMSGQWETHASLSYLQSKRNAVLSSKKSGERLVPFKHDGWWHIVDAFTGGNVELPRKYEVFNERTNQMESATTGQIRWKSKKEAQSSIDSVRSAAEQNAIDAKIEAKIKDIAKKGRGKARSNLPDPELLRDVIELAGLYVQKAGYTVEKFVNELVRRFGEEIRPYAEEAWLVHAPEEPKKATSGPVRPPPASATPKPEAPPAPDDRPVGIKHASTKETAEKLGVEWPQDDSVLTDADALEMAKQAVKADPKRTQRLIDELANEPRAPNKVEEHVLNLEMVRLAKERKAAYESEAPQYEIDALVEQSNKLLQASSFAGTESGRSLQGRKALLASDYSLAKIEYEWRQTHEGEPYTEAARKENERMYEEIKAAKEAVEKERDAAVERAAKAEAEAALLRASKRAARSQASGRPPPKRTAVEEYISRRAAEARARLKSAGVARDVFSVAEDAAWIGADVIAKGAREFTEWVKAMHAEIAERDEKKLRAIYEKSKELHGESAYKAMGERAAERYKTGRGFGKYPEAIARMAVERGAKSVDEVLDVLHPLLKEIDPAITREGARDAWTRYGQHTVPSQDEVSRTVRDLRTQGQKLAQIEALEKKRAPLKTGLVRDEPSPAVRALTKRINNLKKQAGIKGLDRDTTLATALEAHKTALRNAIDDLQMALDTGEPIVRSSESVPKDAEALALKEQRDALKKLYDDTFGGKEKTDEQRAEAAVKAAEASIAEYERQIREHDVARAKEPQGPPTERVAALKAQREALVARRDALRATRDEMRARLDPGRKDEIRLKAAITRTKNREAELLDRVARRDFGKKQRPEPVSSPELVEAQTAESKARQAFERAKIQWERENRSTGRKVYDMTKDVSLVPGGFITAFDVSAPGRQGIFFLAGDMLFHPRRAAKNVSTMLKAFKSEDAHNRVQAQIENHPLYQTMVRDMKIDFSGYDDILSPREEALGSRFLKNVPLVHASNRAYITFLNLQRFMHAKAMIEALPQTPTKADLLSLGETVNDATGRGHLSRANLDAGVDLLRIPFFSPRLYLSRWNLLTGRPLRRATPQTRAIIAESYGKYIAGTAAIISLGVMLGGEFEWDPRSANFGFLRFGRTRIDVTGGLNQYVRLAVRSLTNKTVTQTGEVAETNMFEEGKRFGRNKLNPVVGATTEMIVGKDALDEPVTLKDSVSRLVVPLSLKDIIQTAESQGVPKSMIFSILGLFGFGVQNYRSPEEAKRVEALKKFGMSDAAKILKERTK